MNFENKALEQTTNVELEVDGIIDAEGMMTLQRKLEDEVSRYFQNKDIVKERNEENEIILDRIRAYHEQLGSADMVTELMNGTYAKVAVRTTVREKVDKEALAGLLKVAKDELKTPYDFSYFASKGSLTPEMVTEHTDKKPETKVTVRRVKKKPKDAKQDVKDPFNG